MQIHIHIYTFLLFIKLRFLRRRCCSGLASGIASKVEFGLWYALSYVLGYNDGVDAADADVGEASYVFGCVVEWIRECGGEQAAQKSDGNLDELNPQNGDFSSFFRVLDNIEGGKAVSAEAELASLTFGDLNNHCNNPSRCDCISTIKTRHIKGRVRITKDDYLRLI